VPAWIVAVPGRGRSWQTTVYYSREDAVAAANEFLAAGKDAKKIGIYQAIDFQVQTQPTISL
jgi:hypothetical protein